MAVNRSPAGGDTAWAGHKNLPPAADKAQRHGDLPPSGGRGRGSWVAAVLVALIGAFMSILDSTIVNVAIPTIMHVFNTDISTVQRSLLIREKWQQQ